jgi:AGCS family alanine or glycine:cation symporter
MESLNQSLAVISSYVWGMPLVVLLLGAGLFFTLNYRFIQFRGFGRALKIVSGKESCSDDSSEGCFHPFKALCTALSATVGLGNIGGVAIAISIGGPGATFWMIVVGLIGMTTKFHEVTLARMYREVDSDGTVRGGPMYYIKLVPYAGAALSIMYAFFLIMGSFGAANMFQANQVAAAFSASFGTNPLIIGAILSVLTAVVIFGGAPRIATVATLIVPVMAVGYILGCGAVIVAHIADIPAVIMEILSSAFTGTAAVGGFTGAVFKQTLTAGVRRALFSNEAGLGTSATAHAQGRTKHPVQSGLVALLEPFIDTVVICTMTALIVNVTGAWSSDAKAGVEMTQYALNSTIPGFGTWFIPCAVFLFAYSTLISWSLYGEQGTRFLFSNSTQAVTIYRSIFSICPIAGALWSMDAIINFSDICLGLLVVPNLIACLYLSKKVKAAIKDFGL